MKPRGRDKRAARKDVVEGKRAVGECRCSLRISLVGDGCSVCNPTYWEEMLKEEDDSTPVPQSWPTVAEMNKEN